MVEIDRNILMWNEQKNFQKKIEEAAKALFNKLDSRLNPNVIILGINAKYSQEKPMALFEPKNCDYNSEIFDNLMEFASTLNKSDTREIPVLTLQNIRDAIEKTFSDKLHSSKLNRYISLPRKIDDFYVVTVLELNKDTVDEYNSLKETHWDGWYPVKRSLIEATISEFQKDSADWIIKSTFPFPFQNIPCDEQLRRAGRILMDTIALCVSDNIRSLWTLYQACNEVARLRYEGSVAIGKMILSRKNHKNVCMTLELIEPIPLPNYRKVRKFLELSGKESAIVSDAILIYGLGEKKGNYDPASESLFEVNFSNHLKWELVHDKTCLMSVENGIPGLPRERIDRSDFEITLRKVFKKASNEQIENLYVLALEATSQAHGTMIVVADKEVAESEAERLANQCFRVKPFQLTKEKLRQVCSIDGAVLLDENQICYAIGVILDGEAIPNGDSSRGARYNSAARYFENQKKKNRSPFILIVSEDGMLNMKPEEKDL